MFDAELDAQRAKLAAHACGWFLAALAAPTSAADLTPAAAAALNTPIVAERLRPGETIKLDGTLSHPAWQRAPVHKASFERQPGNGEPAKHDTQVQVLFDDQAVYVGVNALDPLPQQIRESLVRHDQVKRTQDFVAIYIDPIGNRKSAQWFRAAASGSLSDGMHTADDDSEDFAPDFDFDAKVSRHSGGYVTVFRVPFASLRYTSVAPGQPRAPWRMQVVRRVPRDQIYLTMSVAMPQAANNFIEYMQDVQGLAPPAADSFLKLRPNLTVRRTAETAPGQATARDTGTNLGLELKWRPRPELVVDGTFKPDFSQVELDVPQLSRNSQFALFLQEKRPFFLESSDLLRSPTEALYTRSVTLPQYGLRGTWRGESLAGTALLARDRGQGLLLLPECLWHRRCRAARLAGRLCARPRRPRRFQPGRHRLVAQVRRRCRRQRLAGARPVLADQPADARARAGAALLDQRLGRQQRRPEGPGCAQRPRRLRQLVLAR